MQTNLTRKNQCEWGMLDVSKILFELPFNTSLAGYSMLTDAILLTLNFNGGGPVNMTREIYGEIAKSRNINGNSVEKGIKNVIESISSSCLSLKDIKCPNIMIKNALLEGKPKHFIMAVSESIKYNKLKQNQG